MPACDIASRGMCVCETLEEPSMSLRMRVVWEVLEAAKDNHDEKVIAACRRIINANRIARPADPADWRLVRAFADE